MPPTLVRDVILRDGAALRLRSPQPADEADIKAFFDALAPESRYMRFHGPGRTDLPARDYANADGEEQVALLAHLAGRVVAVAGYHRLNDPDAAEVAFAVADDLHGRGLATRMLEQLAEIAAERGIERFDAEVMGENRAMLGVFANAGYGIRRAGTAGEVHLSLDLRPTEALEERIADRTHRAAVASLRPLLAPRSIAVVGASAREESVGGALYRSIVAGGFTGVATPVHPEGAVVGSARAARSLAELPEPPELAIVAVPAAEVPAVAADAAAVGVRALLVVSTGFSDTDEPKGRAREDELLAIARGSGMRLVGPNALGVLNTDPDVRLRALVGQVDVRAGGLALSSQSGALGLALLGHARARGLGVSSFVSVGNRADVSTNDLLELWAQDERTTVVALYVESFGNPRRFAQVARAVSRRKPVVAMRSRPGRAGSPLASEEAGAETRIAAALGEEAATAALFRGAGVLRVESTQALFDAAELFDRQPLPGGRRVGVVTNSGGLGTLAADACAARGLVVAAPSDATRARLAAELPRADRLGNPVDLGVGAGVADEQAAIGALLDDESVDAVLVLHVGLTGEDPAARLEALEARAATAEKPIVASVVGANGNLPERLAWAVPNYRFPEAAVRALGLAAERRAWLQRPHGQPPELDGFDAGAAREVAARAGAGWLGDDDARALLAAAGIPVDEPGGPGPAGAGAAAAGPGDGVLVLAGALQDAELGPVVGVGEGGRAFVVPGDVAFRLAPLSARGADELLAEHPVVRALLAGHDVAALRDALLRLAAVADALPELAEADLDIRVASDGAGVHAWRIRLAPPPERTRPKTW